MNQRPHRDLSFDLARVLVSVVEAVKGGFLRLRVWLRKLSNLKEVQMQLWHFYQLLLSFVGSPADVDYMFFERLARVRSFL
jgi:hypothetical protein